MYDFEKALTDFYTLALEKIKKQNLFDLLLRGSKSIKNTKCDKYSDLDLSIIVYKLDIKTLSSIREIYQTLKKKYPFKISITFLTYDDYVSRFHHHGIKPLFYTSVLQETHSMLGKSIITPSHFSRKQYDFDGYMAIVYLIHDLRIRYLRVTKKDFPEYVTHVVKRVKNCMKNALSVCSSHIEENLNEELFDQTFPVLKGKAQYVNQCRKNLDEICKNYEKGMEIVAELLSLSEDLYHLVILYMQQNYK